MPNPVGRPRKPFDRDTCIKLFRIWCTKAEIAGFFGLSEVVLERRCREWADDVLEDGGNFDTLRNHFGADTKISVRRAQIKKAVTEGNVGMLIWLGKQLLGQKENEESIDNLDIKLSYNIDEL